LPATRVRRPGIVVFDVEGILVPGKRFLFFEVGRSLPFLQFVRIVFYGLLYETGLISLRNTLSQIFKVFNGMQTDAPSNFFMEMAALGALNDLKRARLYPPNLA
jgi:hypothetical protein